MKNQQNTRQWQNIKVLLIIAVFYFILEVLLKITCPIKFLTGISCAGCGMSRAWFSVLHLDLAAAFHFHPLFWTVPIGVVFFFTWHKIPDKAKKGLLISAIILYVAVYIIRMLDPTDSIVVFQPENGFLYSLLNSTIFK